MVDELKKHGIVLHLHICGDTTKITEDFIATGTQVLEIDHKTDAERLKEAARGRTCLLGTSTPTCWQAASRRRSMPPAADLSRAARRVEA